MDKKHKTNLIVELICLVVVIASLFYMYDIFEFHTYSEEHEFDYMLSLNDKSMSIDSFNVFYKDNYLYVDSFNIKFNDTLENYTNYNYTLVFSNDEDKKETIKGSFISNNNTITISNDHCKSSLNDITTATIMIDHGEFSLNKKLKISNSNILYGASKDYRMENIAVNKNYIRYGYLTTTNKNIIKKYPNISFEYRYKQRNKYIVFKKISGLSKDYINKKIYDFDRLDVNLDNKDVNVVVILSNKNNKSFIFKIDLLSKVGE